MSILGIGKKKSAGLDPTKVEAVLFDVWGTTVDWLSGMTAHGQRLGAERGIDADWKGLAEEWRAHYKPAIKRVRDGRRKWANFDTLHREELDKIVGKYGAKKLKSKDRELLTQGWHSLQPWPDVVPALQQLKTRRIIGPLSNGATRQLVDIARGANLPWDVIFGGDIFRAYKPDKRVYLGAAELLGLKPERILLVAAHTQDLEAAKKQGYRTCFVRRPTEDPEPAGSDHPVIDSFQALPQILGDA